MWDYGEAGRVHTMVGVGEDKCIYCSTPLYRFPAEAFEVNNKRLFVQLSICVCCGWWTVYRVHQGGNPRFEGIEGYSATVGSLKELDVTDISAPLDEVRQYFLAKNDSIFMAHPRLFEEVVCSVFKDCGWDARVTAYSGDDGIDVILDGTDGTTVGVQVKRYRSDQRIEAEQIRSLAGALMLGGHTHGVFVTTSSYRKGAVNTAQGLTKRGYRIDLLDATQFLEALGIAQLRTFDLSQERVGMYVCSRGQHVGSGIAREFTEGEDLRDREVAVITLSSDDLLELADQEDNTPATTDF